MANPLLRRLQEKRRVPRFLGLYEVEYSSFNNLVEIHSKASTRNISMLGMSIPVNKAIRTGERLFLKINLPYENRSIYAQGKVIWKKDASRATEGEEYGGIKFLNRLSEDDTRQILRGALRPQPVSAY